MTDIPVEAGGCAPPVLVATLAEAVAPWPDFSGHPIRDRDRIRHPDGTTGTVLYLPSLGTGGEAWRVVYEHGDISRLALQVGDKGQAVVIAAPPIGAVAYPTGSDREVLLYLMQQFDAESWQCPRCGHSEDCATMDSADYLRRYLAAPAAVAPAQEWRWVDERGRAMTTWKQGDPPPMAEVSDARGTMRVEVRALATAPATNRDGFYLASFKRVEQGRGLVHWWMPDNAGYTPDLAQAGVYTKLVPDYHDSEHTVPVPVSFIAGLRVRHVVDVGDTLNSAFRSATALRAAIAYATAPAVVEEVEV